jgi:WD repeat-containing protein 23
MTSTSPDGNPAQIPIFFGETLDYRDVCRIWSCRFSADGKEIIAGGSGKIFGLSFKLSVKEFIPTLSGVVYDLLANKRTVKINAHRADINSCCWADAGSGNILVSASDDTYLKVW